MSVKRGSTVNLTSYTGIQYQYMINACMKLKTCSNLPIYVTDYGEGVHVEIIHEVVTSDATKFVH